MPVKALMQEALSVLTGGVEEAAGGTRIMRTEALPEQHSLKSEPGTAGWILPIVEKKLQRTIQVCHYRSLYVSSFPHLLCAMYCMHCVKCK